MEKIENFLKKLLPVLLIAVILTSYFSLNIVAYYLSTGRGTSVAYPATYGFDVTIAAENEQSATDGKEIPLPAENSFTNTYVITITNKGETLGEARIDRLTLSTAIPAGVKIYAENGTTLLASEGATTVNLSGVDGFTRLSSGAVKTFKFKIVSDTTVLKFNYIPNITAHVVTQQAN